MITAAQALASMSEDIDRLEKKNVVKPGYIKRKRSELDAVHRELATLQAMVDRITLDAVRTERAHRESDLRTGMLANVLSIIGFDPMVHLRRPIENADTYYLAAQNVTQQERERDFERPQGIHHANRTWSQMKDLLNNALWAARLEQALKPFQHLLDKHTPNDATREEEEHQAAA